MKIDINDPRITAFALGELTGDDAIELARAVRSDVRISKAVDEARETAQLLGTVLSPAGAEMLTSDQRAAVRSAGARPEVGDLASAVVPFWKKPAVIATGVAAAVAATLYIVTDQQPTKDGSIVEHHPEWNWSQVETRDLTAPVTVDSGTVENTANPSEAALAVSAAMSDDTEGFRATVQQRIESSAMELARELPELDTKDWQDVSMAERIAVPMSSGASSWPWMKRYILDAGELPPVGAVRIEEMVNHFAYRKPDAIEHGGLVADMELCRTPWNPQTCLLAVHVMAKPGASVENLHASLVIGSDRVKKLRLLGYATAVPEPETEESLAVGTPAVASRTRGNYVLYEVILDSENTDAVDVSLVSLSLGGDEKLNIQRPKDWTHSSPDMRFATAIAATGMILSDYPAAGELDAGRLVSMLDLLKTMDGQVMKAERKDALGLIRRALELVKQNVK